MVSAVGQMFSNMKSGFEDGMALGDKAFKARANRLAKEARTELDDYIEGKAVAGEAPPTTRDLLAIRDRYRKAGNLVNDPEWEKSADEIWATKLTTGFDRFMNDALTSLQNGDMDSAEAAINKASTLMPNGMQYKFDRNEAGELVARGYDEITGEPGEAIPVTARTLMEMQVMARGTPAERLKVADTALMRAQKTREQRIVQAQRERELGQGDRRLSQGDTKLGQGQQALNIDAQKADTQRTQGQQKLDLMGNELKLKQGLGAADVAVKAAQVKSLLARANHWNKGGSGKSGGSDTSTRNLVQNLINDKKESFMSAEDQLLYEGDDKGLEPLGPIISAAAQAYITQGVAPEQAMYMAEETARKFRANPQAAGPLIEQLLTPPSAVPTE